jgi:hypothetical protein
MVKDSDYERVFSRAAVPLLSKKYSTAGLEQKLFSTVLGQREFIHFLHRQLMPWLT